MSGINGTGGVKVGELLRECVKALEAAGNDNPRFEAEQLVMKFCGVKRSDILMFPGLEVTAEQAAEVRGAVQRRNSGEPLQYILRRNIALNGAEELCEAMHADVLSDAFRSGAARDEVLWSQT